MKRSWKGHKDRNRQKNRIKRSGQVWLVYVFTWHPHHVKVSPRGPSGGHEGRFSTDPLQVLCAEGHREQFWQGQGRPLLDTVHPAFPLSTTASPTLQGAMTDGCGAAVGERVVDFTELKTSRLWFFLMSKRTTVSVYMFGCFVLITWYDIGRRLKGRRTRRRRR